MSKNGKHENKKNIKYIITIILTILLIIAVTITIIKIWTNIKEKKEYDTLANYMTNEQSKNEEEQQEEKTEPKKEKTERMLKLEKLNKENKEIVAWIEIPDTNINYPVMYTNDNSYYLNHTYKKEYSELGSIFLDKDVDLKLPSSNFLMYGHRSMNGAMFEDLVKYKKKDFYNKHKTIKFTTMSEDVEYEILAAFYSRVYYKNETNVFRYYYFINAKNEKEYNDYVGNAKKASIYDTGVEAKYGDQLITLSTCDYSQTDGRFAVVAKKIKK